MYVRDYMRSNIVTVDPSMAILDAQKMISGRNIQCLLVVDKDKKLVGLLTKGRFKRSLASHATVSVSTDKPDQALSRMKVKDIMETSMITVTPDTPLDDAVALCRECNIMTLPVLENDKLVGMCTAADLINILDQAMGFGKPGTRLHLFNYVEGEWLARAIDIIHSHEASIRSLFTITPPRTARAEVVIHVDTTDITGIINDLKVRGYNVEARQRYDSKEIVNQVISNYSEP